MKYIILFRHAKAHSIKDYKHDSDRELTEKGKESLINSSKTLTKLFHSFESIEFVSSPFVRAKQTAEMLAKFVDKEVEKTFSSIANGDYERFVKDIRKTQSEALVVVGHQPYLSEFAYQIANASIPFEQASCACIELSSKGNKLIWMLNNESLQSLS